MEGSAAKSLFFYLISDVLPDKNKTGGEVILYRHFDKRKDFEYKKIIITQHAGIFKYLERSRLGSYIKALRPFYEATELDPIKELPQPDFILTVAHGRACYAAMKAAAYWNVPLVTIFHDWYPVSSGVHQRLILFLEWEFKKLYKFSSLALCVSRQMKEALGEHPNSIFLPPIPSRTGTDKAIISDFDNPRLLYAGFCGGAYRSMLQRFMTNCASTHTSFMVSGAETEGLESTSKDVEVLGFLNHDNFERVFKIADILLVFLNFNLSDKMHFSTHFPSKLVEYCGKGKFIAIWGPSYSTSVQWAKETGAAFYFEQDNENEFLRQVLTVYKDEKQRNSIIEKAKAMYAREFNPERIDQLLKSRIRDLFKVQGI